MKKLALGLLVLVAVVTVSATSYTGAVVAASGTVDVVGQSTDCVVKPCSCDRVCLCRDAECIARTARDGCPSTAAVRIR